MSKVVAVLIALMTFNVVASDLKPGLWEIKMKISQNGKEIDPLKEIMKELEKLPESQKNMILEQMKKDPNFGKNTNQVCYTKEELKEPNRLAEDEDQDCEYKEQSKSDKKIVASFKCDDGTKGVSVWEQVDASHMKVMMDATSKDGQKSKVEYSAKFLRTNCK